MGGPIIQGWLFALEITPDSQNRCLFCAVLMRFRKLEAHGPVALRFDEHFLTQMRWWNWNNKITERSQLRPLHHFETVAGATGYGVVELARDGCALLMAGRCCCKSARSIAILLCGEEGDTIRGSAWRAAAVQLAKLSNTRGMEPRVFSAIISIFGYGEWSMRCS